MKFDNLGRELPDSTPLEIPAGMKRPESLKDQIKRLVRTNISQFAEAEGAESFDEANDFDMEEDDDAELNPTHHELHEETVLEVQRVNAEEAQRIQAANSRRALRKSQEEDEEEGETDRAPARDDLFGSEEDSERDLKPRKRARRRRASSRVEDAQDEDDA